MSGVNVIQNALPEGYSNVPQGNRYVTRRCRQHTEAAHRVMYTVIGDQNAKPGPIGLGVPTDILKIVELKEQETREQRAAKVAQHDAQLEVAFTKVMMKMYPKMPETSMPRVIQTALKKGEGKVGRTTRLETQEKVYFAVHAHIRHFFTEYDAILRGKGIGANKWEVRKTIAPQIASIAASWGEPPNATEHRAFLPGHGKEEKDNDDEDYEDEPSTPSSQHSDSLEPTRRITRSLTREESKPAAVALRRKSRAARKKAARLARANESK